MKKILSLLCIAALTLTVAASCQKEEEQVFGVDYYKNKTDVDGENEYEFSGEVTDSGDSAGAENAPADTNKETDEQPETEKTPQTATVPEVTEPKDEEPKKQDTQTGNKITTSVEEDKPSPYTEISNDQDLSEYLYKQYKSGKTKFKVDYIYTLHNNNSIAQMLNVKDVSFTQLKDGRNFAYEIEVTPFAGDNIAKAVLTGDQSKLTSDEKRVLERAQKLVAIARSKYYDPVDIEISLHDQLIETTAFHEMQTYGDVGENDRRMSAVGALLDGKANSQGYADAFYLLCTVAGIECEKMTVYMNGNVRMVNTVNLNNNWYLVDVMADDLNNQDITVHTYRSFNLGLDKCYSYSFETEWLHKTIKDKSDENYYYYLPVDGTLHGYQKVYTDKGIMASAVVNEWATNGRTELQIIFPDTSMSSKDFIDALEYQIRALDKAFFYTVWSTSNGKDTFFYVQFK